MNLHGFMTVLVAVLMLGFSSVATADEKDAKIVYKQALDKYNASEYAEAADLFREAYELRPSWKIFFNIGQCEAAAKRYGLALEAFESYLSEGGDEVAADRRKEVMEEVSRLRNMVGFLKVKAPSGFEIIVDGVPRGKTPLANEIPLGVGVQHKVEARKGETTFPAQTLKVYGKKTAELVFEEEKEEAPVAAAAEEEELQAKPVEKKDEDESADKLAVAGWVTIGVAGGLLIAGGITGAVALNKQGTLEDDCGGTECPTDKQRDIDSVTNLGIATDVMLGVGAAAAVAGTIMLIVSAKRDGEEPVAVKPAVGPGFAGASLTGRF